MLINEFFLIIHEKRGDCSEKTRQENENKRNEQQHQFQNSPEEYKTFRF